ncbi:MAG TPA: Ig-like domain-containing protein [Polyangiaceae bacterium]|nr:Ig-like domain-containing protein [Polyangiaceae bacterium]
MAVPFALGLLLSGCELGPRDEASAHGPPLHIMATYPADGQGTNASPNAPLDCDSPTPDCPLPTNLAIELRFDRFLLPGDRIGAGLRLYTGDPDNSIALAPEYNLIERVVVFRPQQALHPNTLYTAETVTSTDPNLGFWAFDRAPLSEGPVPLSFSFSTGSGPAPVASLPVAPVESCATMINGPFVSCANCHVTQPGDETVPPSPPSGITERVKYPPMGLDLSSPPGLYYTAIQHVAHQTETGNSVLNQGLESPDRFGVQMNVVDPGNPSNSYLMYKLLAKPDNYRLDASEPSCVTGYHAPVSDGNCQPVSDDEAVQLREWFMRGDPMPENATPAPGSAPSVASISHAGLLRINAWIATGASCDQH